MIYAHPVWFLVIAACVIWYSTITIYVAVKGTLDIRKMLRDLQARGDEAEKDKQPDEIDPPHTTDTTQLM